MVLLQLLHSRSSLSPFHLCPHIKVGKMTKGCSHRKLKTAAVDREQSLGCRVRRKSRVFFILKIFNCWIHQYFLTCNLFQCIHINETFDLIHLIVYLLKLVFGEALLGKITLYLGLLPQCIKSLMPFVPLLLVLFLFPSTATYNI